MTHDYKRNGTTTLFAALNMLDGTVIGECMPATGIASSSASQDHRRTHAAKSRPASHRRRRLLRRAVRLALRRQRGRHIEARRRIGADLPEVGYFTTQFDRSD
jgi:hypothetical protein